MKRLGPKGELALPAIIMLVTVFFRTFRLDSLPRSIMATRLSWTPRLPVGVTN